MRINVVLIGLTLYACAGGWAGAQGVFALPQSAVNAVTAPGVTFSSSFYDADGEAVTLPEEGRYLLWLVDAAFALETREEIPAVELDPGADAAASLFNPTAELLPRFIALEETAPPGYVLFYERLALLPDAAERAEAWERFAPLTVLFDDDGVFPKQVSDGMFSSAPRLEGLYLMEGQTVRYRYSGPGLWEGWDVTGLVFDGARAFLSGAEPVVAPVPATVGAELPLGLLPVSGPALTLRMGDGAVDVPPGSVPDEHAQAGAALAGAVNVRFLLETLPPLLERHGVQGVGLVTDGPERLGELGRAFPAWTFVPMERPEDWLAWLEVQTLVVDDAGEVRASFILFPARPEDPDRDALERALRAVSER